ncbi:hypothetical protein RvY_16705 [Ramazzottius varieornatus]|uniref:Uncharacterized protein n=1 Tax=Ramazzottius varieornatus TaxID=947166 RepID=A0A1D1W5R7_RAMVA|nr:hypothetical protein RvY_16705 [Ramazzottius varieornatus]
MTELPNLILDRLRTPASSANITVIHQAKLASGQTAPLVGPKVLSYLQKISPLPLHPLPKRQAGVAPSKTLVYATPRHSHPTAITTSAHFRLDNDGLEAAVDDDGSAVDALDVTGAISQRTAEETRIKTHQSLQPCHFFG